MNDSGHVLVIGAAGVDIKAKSSDALQWEQSNPGIVRHSIGGVARNVGENLARLDVKTILLSAVGDDVLGKRVRRATRAGGVSVRHVRVVPGERTGSYVSIFKPDGTLWVAIHDFDIMSYVDRNYLLNHAELFETARLVFIDSNLNDEALDTVFELAEQYGVKVAADPTAPVLAGKLCSRLDRLYFLTANAAETTQLCGLQNPAKDRDTAIEAARQLVSLGVSIAVVTLGESGAAYADSSGGGYIRAVRTQVIDPTGAGDAFTGAVIFGLLNDVGVDEAMRLGTTAASLTLLSKDTVLPNLSQELLYDNLTV